MVSDEGKRHRIAVAYVRKRREVDDELTSMASWVVRNRPRRRRVRPGHGGDHVWLGHGFDLVSLRVDGAPDTVLCGDDSDTVTLVGGRDPRDSFAGCETFERVDVTSTRRTG